MTGMDQLPKTIRQAVQAMLSWPWADEPGELDHLRSLHEEDLRQLHRWFGMGVRNSLGLWGSNPELLEACRATHPDEASAVLIEALWAHLQQTASPEDLDRARRVRAKRFLAALPGAWLSLARYAGLAANDAERIRAGRRLVDGYFGKPLPYHNAEHVLQCLHTLSMYEAGTFGYNVTVGLALWFHDAIYVPGAADNEACSARLAKRVLTTLGMAEGQAQRVASLILATAHREPPASADEELICDIDLSILGQPWPVYERYAAAIRSEYALPPDEFALQRAKFLRSMLDRKLIFHTHHFRHRLEQTARGNMRRELADLGKQVASMGSGLET